MRFTTARMMQEALGELRGLLEIAEWVASADVAALGGGTGTGAGAGMPDTASWVHRYLRSLLQGGLCSLASAYEDVDESGDLRQLGVDKIPAKGLYAALEVCGRLLALGCAARRCMPRLPQQHHHLHLSHTCTFHPPRVFCPYGSLCTSGTAQPGQVWCKSSKRRGRRGRNRVC